MGLPIAPANDLKTRAQSLLEKAQAPKTNLRSKAQELFAKTQAAKEPKAEKSALRKILSPGLETARAISGEQYGKKSLRDLSLPEQADVALQTVVAPAFLKLKSILPEFLVGETPESQQKIAERAQVPIVQPSALIPKKTIGQAAAKGAVEAIEGLTSSENIALAAMMARAPRSIARVGSAAFAGLMASQLPELYNQFKAAEDPREKIRLLMHGLATGLFTGFATKHALTKAKAKLATEAPKVVEPIKPVEEHLVPEAAVRAERPSAISQADKFALQKGIQDSYVEGVEQGGIIRDATPQTVFERVSGGKWTDKTAKEFVNWRKEKGSPFELGDAEIFANEKRSGQLVPIAKPKLSPIEVQEVEKLGDPKAQVKMMITRADEKALADLGYTPEQIGKLRPEDAQKIVAEKQQIVETIDGKKSAVSAVEGTPSQLPLTTAIVTKDGKMFIGQAHETHGDIVERFDIDADTIIGDGFVNKTGKYFTRKDALTEAKKARIDVQPTEERGERVEADELDSADYFQAVVEKPAEAELKTQFEAPHRYKDAVYYRGTNKGADVSVAIDDNGVGHVNHLLTRENMRRRGFGIQAVTDGIEFLKSKGITRIETIAEGPDSRTLFEKVGFKFLRPDAMGSKMVLELRAAEPARTPETKPIIPSGTQERPPVSEPVTMPEVKLRPGEQPEGALPKEPAKPFGSENIVVKTDEFKAAVERLKKRAVEPKFQAGGLADLPANFKDLVTIGTYVFEGGTRQFAAWSKRMVDELGDWVKPHLERIWQASQAHFATNIRLSKFSPEAREKIKQAAVEIPFAQSEAQRRGIQSHQMTIDQAGRETKIVQAAREGSIAPGTPATAAQIYAIASDIENLSRSTGTPEGMQAFVNAVKALQGVKAEVGRAVEIQKEVAGKIRGLKETVSPEVEKILDDLDSGKEPLAGWQEKLVEWARNVKLASGSSIIRSFVGNLTSNILKYPQALASSAFNRVLKWITGAKRDRFAEEAGVEVLGTLRTMKEASYSAWDTLLEKRKALEENEFLMHETGRSEGAIKGKKGVVIRTPQRAQGAIDALFRVSSTAGLVHRLAVRRAKQEGLTGADYLARVADLQEQALPNDFFALRKAQEEVRTGTITSDQFQARVTELQEKPFGERTPDGEAIFEEARKGAKDLTYQSELGKLGRYINLMRQKAPLTQLVIPFFSTWVNLWKKGIQHTPLAPLRPTFWRTAHQAFQGSGALKAIGKIVGSKTLREGAKEQRQLGEFSDELSAMTIGTATTMAMFATISEVLEGTVVGRGPDDLQEQKRLRAQGWQPYSIKYGDKYYSFRGFEPISTWLTLLADGMQGQRDKGFIGAFDAVSSNVVRNFADNPFLTGVGDFMDFLRGKSKPEEYAASMALGVTVPTILQQTARVIDPSYRETPKDLDFFGRAGAEFIKRVPFASDILSEQLDPFGEVVKADLPEGRLVAIGRTTLKTDPVNTELRRLDIGVGQPGRAYKNRQLTDDEYRNLILFSGPSIKRGLDVLFKSPLYSQLTDEEKGKAIDLVVSGVRDTARKTLFGTGAEGVLEALQKLRKKRSRESLFGTSKNPASAAARIAREEAAQFTE